MGSKINSVQYPVSQRKILLDIQSLSIKQILFQSNQNQNLSATSDLMNTIIFIASPIFFVAAVVELRNLGGFQLKYIVRHNAHNAKSHFCLESAVLKCVKLTSPTFVGEKVVRRAQSNSFLNANEGAKTII